MGEHKVIIPKQKFLGIILCFFMYLEIKMEKRDESVVTEARSLFAQLEAGNSQLKTQWSPIRSTTVDSLTKVYARLIQFMN